MPENVMDLAFAELVILLCRKQFYTLYRQIKCLCAARSASLLRARHGSQRLASCWHGGALSLDQIREQIRMALKVGALRNNASGLQEVVLKECFLISDCFQTVPIIQRPRRIKMPPQLLTAVSGHIQTGACSCCDAA